jgi:hypothetical protein
MTTGTTAAATAATTTAKPAARSSSLATSARFKAFAVTFALTSTLMYLACEWFNLPAFTYHPATNKVGWWWEAGRSGEGPAMYWYGWSAMSLAIGLVAGLIGTLLPEGAIKRIPLFLVWLLPFLVFIPLTYSLMPFWTK